MSLKRFNQKPTIPNMTCAVLYLKGIRVEVVPDGMLVNDMDWSTDTGAMSIWSDTRLPEGACITTRASVPTGDAELRKVYGWS
jgi:hypothetical protein